MVIIAKYGFSTTIPALSFKSSSEVTINAAALDEEISFLNLGKNANVIDLFEKMKELIKSEELSKKLILKGFERVKKYNRYNFIKDLEKIY